MIQAKESPGNMQSLDLGLWYRLADLNEFFELTPLRAELVSQQLNKRRKMFRVFDHAVVKLCDFCEECARVRTLAELQTRFGGES